MRQALGDCVLESDADGPVIDTWWGEPGLTPAERVFGWCSLEVLAFETGNPASPVNAIPSKAWARMQLRFVDGVEPDRVLPAVRAHLQRNGFAAVDVKPVQGDMLSRHAAVARQPLGRLGGELDHARRRGPSRRCCRTSAVRCRTTASPISCGMPTLWVPHSYPACAQHAPNEHLPIAIAREGLAIMAGLYWDLGEAKP